MPGLRVGLAPFQNRDGVENAPSGRSVALIAPAANLRNWLWAAVLALIILIGAVSWFARRGPEVTGNPIANGKFTQLTDFEGIERDAVISPDGRFVAFVSDRDGPLDIWLSQIGTGRFINLTQGKEPNLDSLLRVAGFTSDGSGIWFHDLLLESPLRLLPLVGGPSRIFLDKSPMKMPPINAAWSPDGNTYPLSHL